MAEIGAREGDEFKAICTEPSINKTPVGSAMVPVAYPVLHDLTNSTSLAKTTRFNGHAAYLFDQSRQSSTTGDEPGVGKGIRSNTVDGEVKPTQGAKSFRIEGKPVVRAMDKCTLNGGNCNGLYVTVAAPSGSIMGGKPTNDTDPPKQLTAEQKKAWYEKTWDTVKDAGVWAKNEATTAANEVGAAVTHPIEAVKGFGKDLVNTAVDVGNLVSQAGYAQGQADLAHDAAMTSLTNPQAGNEMAQLAQNMKQNPQWATHFDEPFQNLSEAERGGALISNFSPKGVGKALIVGGVKTIEKDALKTALKDGEKALSKDAEKAAKQAEEDALKKAEQEAAKKKAEEEAAKKKAEEDAAKQHGDGGEKKKEPDAKVKQKKRLKCGEFGKYGKLKQKTGGGKFDRDHIPSKAALKAKAREMKGDRLTKDEEKAIDNYGDAIAIPRQAHIDVSPTYGQSLGDAKVDAKDLAGSARRDVEAMLAKIDEYDADGGCKKAYQRASRRVLRKSNADFESDILKVLSKFK